MIGYIVRRLLTLIPILLFASVVVFLMLHLVPGDAATAIAGRDVTPEQLEALRQRMGLNEPLYRQYLIWLGQILRGDLGVSNVSHLPVATLIAGRLPATLELTTAAIVFAVLIAVPGGILAALHPGKTADQVVSVTSSFGLSVPEYWSGLLAIILFSIVLGWLPPGGRVAPEESVWLWARSLLLPAITLGLPLASMQVRFVRASMIEVMREQYILTARSKGLSRFRIIVIHALRNSLIPLMTVLGIQVGRLMGGAILVESIYSWPGIGRMMVQSIGQRDYALVQAEVLLIVVIFTVLNLIIDILYGVIDPRVRTGSLVGAMTMARDLPQTIGRRGPGRLAMRRFLRSPAGRYGGTLFLACVLIAVFAGYIAPFSPLAMERGAELRGPSAVHLLGTDEFGRDLLSRIIFGVRMSLLVAFTAVVVGGVPGIVTGLYTGYYAGVGTTLILRLWDGLLAFPPLLLAIIFAAILGPGPLNAAIALGIISVPEFSRIVRAAVLAEKEKDYILASRSMGVKPLRIIFRNLLPNVTSPILVQVAIAMGAAIALEAALSFVGLGIQPPDPSLGSMLSISRKYLYQAWWYAVFPGVAITLLLIGLNWFAQALTEALDPRSAPR